jgi:endonuclease/exonuclease/phosphatase family metal-dependent hydrolase
MMTSENKNRKGIKVRTTKKFGLVLIILMVGISIPIQAQNISVMSVNIRYNNPADGINSWENRREWLFDYIRFSEADLIGGQEVMKSQLFDMNESLSFYSYIGVARNGVEEGEYCPIFYKTDRFEVLDNGTFWLSETPEKIDSKGWDAALPRIVTWGRFMDKILDKEIYFFNTHFDHMGEISRTESARLLIKKVTDIAGENPVFVTGDFNFSPDKRAYHVLTQNNESESNINDAMLNALSVYGPSYTFNGFRIEPESEGERIDYIFSKGDIDVLKYQVVDGQRGSKYISDHFPVLVEAKLK